MVRTLGDVQIFLVIPQPVLTDPAKTQRLYIYEYIVNVKQMLGENGSSPIYKGVLYTSAPFPVTNSTNNGNVRVYA